MINKKAQLGEQMTFFAFLFLLIIIGLGIVAGVYIFFGSGYDFRSVDADLLNYKIRNCISNNLLDDNFKNNFYEICKIDLKVIEDKNYIIRILADEKEFFDFGDELQCELSAKNINYPKCTSVNFNSNGKNIFILTGSNQQSRGANA